MLSWGVIGYGAALSAVLAAVASVVTVRERRPIVVAGTVFGAFATVLCALLAAVGGVSAECRSWCRVNGPPALPTAQPEAEPPRTGSV